MTQYRVILADPPWSYRELKLCGPRAAERHYATMTLAAITALPVRELAAKDAALFLWVTSSHLPYAFSIMDAWGFAYSSIAFNWVKVTRDGRLFPGMGAYTRRNSELCLLGIRGKPKRRSRDVLETMLLPRRQHSRKPDEQYERIMRLFDGPYLEMFSRQQWPGWDTWGNQTGKFPAQPFLLPESMVSA